jgi:hypothetical protein
MERIYLALMIVSLLAAVWTFRSKRLLSKKYRDAIEEASKSAPPTEGQELPKLEPAPNDLMKQYEMMVDIYKFHFEMVLKFVAFYYLITGGIVSYWLGEENTGFMRFALALPIGMGVSLGYFAIYGAREVDPFKKDITRVARGLHLDPFPNMTLLTRLKSMLRLTSWFSFVTAISLFLVSIWRFFYP